MLFAVLSIVVVVLCAQNNALGRLHFYRESLSPDGMDENVLLTPFDQQLTTDDDRTCIVSRKTLSVEAVWCRWKEIPWPVVTLQQFGDRTPRCI
uniref:Secreted protein n=1 Tax=Ascaris lumbricoides TaxID=6252 RepID=A0A0M3I994_ASCLU